MAVNPPSDSLLDVPPTLRPRRANIRPHIPSEPGVTGGETPQERIPLWALADQVKDVSGEIALAVDMLDSEDPEEAQVAIDLLNTYVDAEHSAKAVLYDKADAIASYVVALQRQASARRRAAEEDYLRAKNRADRDDRRAERLLNYLHTQLRRIEPDAKRFELPSYDLTSRVSPPRTVVDDIEQLPDEFLAQPAPPKPKPDLAAIKRAIQSGQEVPGARLVPGERKWDIKR